MAKKKAGPRDYAAEAVAKIKSTAKGRAALKRSSDRLAEMAANPPMASSSSIQDEISEAFRRGANRARAATARSAPKASTLKVFPPTSEIPPEFLSKPMTANEVAMLVEGKKFSAAMKWLKSSGIRWTRFNRVKVQVHTGDLPTKKV